MRREASLRINIREALAPLPGVAEHVVGFRLGSLARRVYIVIDLNQYNITYYMMLCYDRLYHDILYYAIVYYTMLLYNII